MILHLLWSWFPQKIDLFRPLDRACKMYRVVHHNRSYISPEFSLVHSGERVDLSASVGARLFTQEIFDWDAETGAAGPRLRVSSPVRTEVQAGVLVLEGGGAVGRTYGRSGGRFLYQCIPRDGCLPPFLVPYSIRKVGFSKRLLNLYVLFKFVSWGEGRWPVGMLVDVLGPVSDLSAYGDYLLHSFGLGGRGRERLSGGNLGVGFGEPEAEVFTVDGAGTEDFDDALSWRVLEDGRLEVCVYITNVCRAVCGGGAGAGAPVSPWVATIYMPGRKRIPMLPADIRAVCSLVAGSVRECVVCRFVDGVCVDVRPSVWVRVLANYCWEDEAELVSGLVGRLGLSGSRELVAHWMCRFNSALALRGGWGFYRGGGGGGGGILAALEERTLGFGGGYAWLPGGDYLPMTNPLRRMVDLLNQMILCGVGAEFVAAWAMQVDYLNLYGRRIRRVQRECGLLAAVSALPGGVGEFDGVMFGEVVGGRVSVWLPELRLFSRCSVGVGVGGVGSGRFRLFYFKEADDVRQKVRVCLVEGGC